MGNTPKFFATLIIDLGHTDLTQPKHLLEKAENLQVTI
jgi:hypothetical protein